MGDFCFNRLHFDFVQFMYRRRTGNEEHPVRIIIFGVHFFAAALHGESPRLRDKIWVGPGDEARKRVYASVPKHYIPFDPSTCFFLLKHVFYPSRLFFTY